MASCAVHTQFTSGANKYLVTRDQMVQNEANARSYAFESGPVADHIFLAGDYNLYPTSGFAYGKPGPIMDAQWHGNNIAPTHPNSAPTGRIDHIYFSKELKYLTTDVPICSGPGIVTTSSVPTYPNGDHCYIGVVAYGTEVPDNDDAGSVGNGSTSQNIDSEEGQIQYQNGNDQKKGGFPGVPKSGTQTGIVLMLLPVILFGFVVRSEWVKSRENLLA